jgi:hypothetical protein
MLCFAALLGIACQGIAKPKPSKSGPNANEVLVSVENDRDSKDFAKGIGRVVGEDKGSDMLIVQLDKHWNADKAIAALSKRKGVKLALPMSAKDVDRMSLASVTNHAKYLDAFDDDKADAEKPLANGKVKIKVDRGDYFNALKYYLERHVAVGSDHVDFAAIKNGVKHREQMPKVSLNGTRPDPKKPSSLIGNTWTFIGPKNMASPYNIYYGTPPLSGRISCLAYDPNTSSTIYAGSGGGGLWKSTNSGSTWTCMSDTSPWIYPDVDCIAVDPTNTQILYVGTGDYDGFLSRLQSGRHEIDRWWQHMDEPGIERSRYFEPGR